MQHVVEWKWQEAEGLQLGCEQFTATT